MKQMIWTSETWFDDAAREDYQSSQRAMLEDDSYEVSDEEWSEAVEMWLYDERQNLDKEVDGVIVAFADLGLWNGRRQGTIIFGTNIANILKSTCDTAEWYCDRYNVRGRMAHHDGTNHVLYRIAKDRNEAERIAEKVYNREVDERKFRRMTRSLYPYVAEVYGWKVARRKPNN
ncbi:hypothetical protein [Marseilla massiliensis]|jgi:hypothetical protein|uniref:hypothetical protein n=1 Tax=Marseilla massiliensis TaxID=1841864 RepID=UPI0030C88F77